MSQRRNAPKKKPPIDTRPILEELEPRQLFSGGVEGLLLDDPLAEPPVYLDITNEKSGPGSALVADIKSTESAVETERQELVFIDTDVENYQELLNDILAQDDSERNIEVVLLDNQRDGIEQISEVLAGYQNLDAVHLISHGSDGSVDVGNSRLDADSLTENLTAIKAWSESFSEEGDFLIYGCNLAATEDGQSLIDALSALTAADVAASDDLTGSETLGGDWELEYNTGSIETDIAISQNSQLNWNGVLDISTGLVGHWTLDSDGTDSSGNALNGTLIGNATIDNSAANQNLGSGNILLDGNDDYLDLSSSAASFNSLTQGTISGWIKTTDATNTQTLFAVADQTDTLSFATLGVYQGNLFFDVAEETSTNAYLIDLETNAFIADGNWHHIAATVDATGNSLYVDGVKIAAANLTYNYGNASSTNFLADVQNVDAVQIGVTGEKGNYVYDTNGSIDDVRVYNRALIATDINDLFTGNTAPVITSNGGAATASINVTENTTTVTTVTATDADSDPISYSISGGTDAALFTIDTNTGVLSFNVAPNFENPTDSNANNIYEVTVQADDGNGGTDSQAISITVTDINDAPDLLANSVNPTFSEGGAAVSLYSFVSPQTYDSAQTIEELVFTVTNVTDGGNEQINLDGSTFALTDMTSGTTATNGYGYSVSLSGTNATLTLTTTDASTADIANLFISLSYENSSENPTTLDRVFTITSIKDSGGTANGGIDTSSPNLISTVTVVAVNDAPTFLGAAGDNIVTTAIGPKDDIGNEVAVQSDGKILVAGTSNNGANMDMALTRYNSDGTLDTSFGGGDGVATVAAGFGNDYGYSLTVQGDGKILMAGYSYINTGPGNDFTLVRFNADGTLDSSFGGGDGIVTTGFGYLNDTAYSVTVQSDGKVLVVGGSNSDIAMARYNTDGTLDSSFGGGDGLVSTAIGGGIETGYSVTIQVDGKILIAGESSNGINKDIALLRYNTDGTLDASFGGGDGIVTTAIGSGDDIGNSIAIQSDGKILIAGESNNGSNKDVALLRYNTDGTLDTGFGGGDGKGTTAIGSGDDVGNSIVLQSDGKILVAGSSNNGTNNDFALLRYNTDGSLDTSFSGDGKLTTAIGSGNDTGFGVTVQADGKILVAGETLNGSYKDIALLRYNTDGTLDTTFEVVNTLDGSPTFTEGGPAVVLDSDVQIFDAELSATDDFSGATLTLVRNGGASAEDIFTSAGNLAALIENGNLVLSGITIGTVTTNSAGTLVLTFNANATQARVNETLQSIAYSNSSDNPPATAQIDWAFNDGNAGAQGAGGALEANGSTTVTITSVNDAPSGADKTVITNEDTDYVFTISDFGFSDVESRDNNFLNVIIATAPANGILYLDANSDGIIDGGETLIASSVVSVADISAGKLKFQPVANANGAGYDSFTFQVQDDGGTVNGGIDTDQSANTITIDITAVNDVPVATGNTVIASEDVPLVIGAGDFNFTDTEGDSLASVTITGLTLNGGTLTHTSGTVNVTNGMTVTAAQFADLTFTSASNDSTDSSFTYTVNDAGTGITSAIMNITVNAVNDVPVASNDSSAGFSTNEDTGFTTGNVLTNDALGDPTSSITAFDGTSLNGGSVTYNNDGTFDYTPATNFNGSDTFTYTITDNDGETSTATVTINVTAVNDVPVASNDSGAGFSTNEDTGFTTGNVLTNDALGDPTTTVTAFDTTSVNGGTVSYNNDGTFNYTPAANFNGSDTFTYTITDNDGETSTATVTLAVNAINDVPVTSNDSGAGFSTNEDIGFTTGNVLTNDALGDPATTITAFDSVSVNGGTVSYNNDGTFNYTPASNFNGSDSFTYTITDNDGETSTATVTINVVAVNDAPTATNLNAAESYTEDTPLNLTDIVVTDVDNATTTVTLTLSDVAAGSLNTGTSGAVTSTFVGGVWTASGAVADVNTLLANLTFTPSLNYNSNFTIATSVDDGTAAPATGIKNISGTAVNDAPVLTGSNDFNSISEDPVLNSGTLVSDLIAGYTTDVDAGVLSGLAVVGVDNTNGTWEFTIDGGSSWSSLGSPDSSSARLLTADANTSVRFVPAANYNGRVMNGLTFRAWDQTTGINGGVQNISGVISAADKFSAVSYSNNDGTASWTTDWIESDSNGGSASGGYFSVDGATSQLKLAAGNGGDNIYREINLSGATTATLTFDYQNVLTGEDEIRLKMSGNGGANYTAVFAFSGTVNNGSGSVNIDISAYISADTRIRFQVFKNDAGNDLFIDNVNVIYSKADLLPGGKPAFSSVTQSSSITITPVNDAPVGQPVITGIPTEDQILTADISGISDVDGLGVFSYQWLRDGVAIGGATDSTYTLGDADVGSQIGVQVSYTDGQGATEGPLISTQTNVVANVDDPATIGGVISYSGNEGDVRGGTMTATDVDGLTDGTYFNITSAASNGTAGIDPATGAWTFIPTHLNWFGSDVFIVTVTDDLGGTTTQIVNITLANVDDPAVIGGAISYSGNEGDTGSGTMNATDVEGLTDNTYFTVTNPAANGAAVIDPTTGAWTFTPTDPNWFGSDTFTVTVTDDMGGTTTQIVNITLNAVNDVPVATGNTVIASEDVPLVIGAGDFNFTDVEGDALASITITGLTLNGGTLTHSAGAVTVTNGMTITAVQLADLTFTSASNDSTDSSFTYTVNDAGTGITSAVMNITVNAVNDVPVATGNTVIANEDIPLVIGAGDFNFTDEESDSLASVTITGLNLNGGTLTHSAGTVTVISGMTVTLAQLADLTFTSALNDSTDSSFTYTVNDIGSGVTSAVMNITVNSSNDAPVANPDTTTTTAGIERHRFSVLSNDVDVDGNRLTVTRASASNGTVLVNEDGSLSYTAKPNFSGIDTITYDISDGKDGVATTTVTVTVMPQYGNPFVDPGVDPGHDLEVASDDALPEPTDPQVIDPVQPIAESEPIETEEPPFVERALLEEILQSFRASDEALLPMVEKSKPGPDGRSVIKFSLKRITLNETVKAVQLEEISLIPEDSELWVQLDQMKEEMSLDLDDDQSAITIVAGTTVTFTAGFVSWVLRSGSLMASFLSSVPLFKQFDPLPILSTRFKKEYKEVNDDDSEDLLAKAVERMFQD